MILVTGATGFAGSHLLDLLVRDPDPIVAWYRPAGRQPARHLPSNGASVQWRAVDLLTPKDVRAGIEGAEPQVIYHCAGAAQVSGSWDHGTATLATNVLATHHLLEAVRLTGLRCRTFIAGSALVYRQSERALTEDDPVGPSNPYGLSKLAQEMIGTRAAASDAQAVVLARAFNHFGPRQTRGFVASDFAYQIARVEAGMAPPVLEVGNLQTRRDLTDVRDVARAYRAIATGGVTGRIYNVCSGGAYSIREILDGLLALSTVPMQVSVDQSRLRPNDNPVVIGSPDRIARELAWTAEIPLQRTLSDLLAYWRQEIRRAPDS